MKTKIKPHSTLMVFGRQVDVIWDEENKKFIPICFRDADTDNTVAIYVGQSIHYLDKKAGIKNNNSDVKKGTITKLIYPYENKWLQWLVEIEGIAHPLEYQWQTSSE